MRTDTLFYCADLRSGVVDIPPEVAPAALWLTLTVPGREDCPDHVPAWPLTPAAHASLWLACVRLEDRWRGGDYPDAKMATVWERWGKIDAWALGAFGEAGLLDARGKAILGAPAPRRPSPPPLGPTMVPFREWPAGSHTPGMSKSSVQAERKKATVRPRRAAKRKTGGGLFG